MAFAGGDGGLSGLRVVQRALIGLAGRLNERGQAQIIGATPSDGFFPTTKDDLSGWAGDYGPDLTTPVTLRLADAPHRRFGDLQNYYKQLLPRGS